MPRNTTTTLNKIIDSESKFKALIDKRNNELVEIITRANAITIDDNLLKGFLMFALNPDNKEHSVLKEFAGLAKANKTLIELKRIIRKLYYFRMQYKKQSLQERRLDARKKIMLGGLFVKAGLDDFYPYDPATLYGMLLEDKELMQNNPTIKDKWKEMGKELIK